MNGTTGKTIPFGPLDDGADLVETSYLFMGLLCAKEYFNRETPLEKYFRNRIRRKCGMRPTGTGIVKETIDCYTGIGVRKTILI